MLHLVASGILGVSLCIDPCVTAVILVMILVMLLTAPSSSPHDVAARTRSSSARHAEVSVDEAAKKRQEEAAKRMGEEAAKKDEGVARERVANPRRVVAEAPEQTPRGTKGGASPHGDDRTSSGGNRSRASHRRLMETLRSELMGGRLHQYSDARVFKAKRDDE